MLTMLVYDYVKFALYKIKGCLAQIERFTSKNLTSLADYAICTKAEDMCRDNVEGVHYDYGERGAVSQLSDSGH